MKNTRYATCVAGTHVVFKPKMESFRVGLSMRIKLPHNDSKRVKSGFLLFPKTICRELRWLCFAKWEQYYNDY